MTKAAILAEVQNRTGRTDVTDIDNPLLAILIDITTRWGFLKKIADFTIADEAWQTSLPTGFRQIDGLFDTDGKETEEVPNLAQFMYFHGDGTTTGEANRFHVYGKYKVLTYPTADEAYVFVIAYSYFHPDTLSSIELGDEFLECVVNGVCWKVFLGLTLPSEGAPFQAAYEIEIGKRISAFPKESVAVQPRSV